MIVGVPKEIKDNEYRVSMTPGGIHQLVVHGHTVLVEKSAGEGSLFSDRDFAEAGGLLFPRRRKSGARPI